MSHGGFPGLPSGPSPVGPSPVGPFSTPLRGRLVYIYINNLNAKNIKLETMINKQIVKKSQYITGCLVEKLGLIYEI